MPTCIGFGAMERWGTCDTACSEHRLELVSAADFDGLEADRSAVRARVGACRPVVATLAGTEPGPDGWQALYRASQRAALAGDPGFARGLNVKPGEIVCEPVATAYADGAPVAAW